MLNLIPSKHQRHYTTWHEHVSLSVYLTEKIVWKWVKNLNSKAFWVFNKNVKVLYQCSPFSFKCNCAKYCIYAVTPEQKQLENDYSLFQDDSAHSQRFSHAVHPVCISFLLFVFQLAELIPGARCVNDVYTQKRWRPCPQHKLFFIKKEQALFMHFSDHAYAHF